MVAETPKTVALVLAGLVASVLVFFAAAGRLEGLASGGAVTEPPFLDVRTEFIAPIFMGHGRVYDDLLALWSAQLLTDEPLRQNHGDELVATMHRIARHKPRTESFYTYACVVLSMMQARPADCLSIAAVGLEVAPDGWLLPLAVAWTYQLGLKQPDKAVPFYALAARSSQAPAFVKETALALSKSESLEKDADQAMQLMRDATAGTELRDLIDSSSSGSSSGSPGSLTPPVDPAVDSSGD